MAQLQTSGAISIVDLQNFFGGDGTPMITEYYRGGGRVPTTRSTTTTTFGAWSAYRFSALTLGGGPDPGSVTDGWILLEQKSTGTIVSGQVWSGGVFVGNSVGTLINFGSDSGFQFERGSFVGSNEDSTYIYYFYEIRSRSFSTTTTTQDINLSVPSSGNITITNFYGAVDG